METIKTDNLKVVANIGNSEKISDDKLVIEFINQALNEKINISKFKEIFENLRKAYPEKKYIGNRRNNSGLINVAGDPGKSAIERKTNNFDGVYKISECTSLTFIRLLL